MKVLVVDDSGVIRSILVRVLRTMGIRRITEAADGDEAWEYFEAQPADLVLTDWYMPRMSGLELTKRIRTIAPQIPIVMITVVDSKERVIEALQAGISDYLCKPFERDALQAKLDRYIPVQE